MERGQMSEARAELDHLLSRQPTQPAGVLNGWRAERMRVAISFDDFLRWAPRTPIRGMDVDNPDSSQVLAPDSVDVLNFQTPLTKLAAAAQSARLPQWSRDDIALAAWTRAFVVTDSTVLRELAPAMARAHPGWNGVFEPTPVAADPAWKFQTALLMARHSDFRPTVAVDYRKHLNGENWWCAVEPPTSPNSAGPNEMVAWRLPVLFQPPTAVVSVSERQRANREVDALRSAGPAQAFLGPIILDWARTHPDDERVPEALHRLVRIIRYGCARTDPVNARYSKAAFDLLHTRYPANAWTRKTPYWFQ